MGNTLNAKYGLKRVINASGRMSILGVSTPTDHVMDAMKIGGQNYVEIDDLVHKSGNHVAKILRTESAVIVNSASSGIALSVAALVTKGNRRLSERLHQDRVSTNEVILFKGHNVQYGAPIETMISLGGGKPIEVGYANEGKKHHISDAINEHTVAILYVKSHHTVQKNMISIKEAWELANHNNVPLIVDAAAEEDLQKYADYSDLVIFSGSKAIEGPTSGIVGGKKKYVDWLRIQLHGIGRSMKVGKETYFGLLEALEQYGEKVDKSKLEKESLQGLLKLNEIDGVKVTLVQDEAGRPIFRARIQINSDKINTSAIKIADELREGEVAIYTRDYGVKQGYFDIDPRPLHDDDIDVIETKLHSLLGGL